MEGGADAPRPTDAGWIDRPPRAPEPKELIESKLIPCDRCGVMVARLIFAPGATDAGVSKITPLRCTQSIRG